MPQDIDDQIRDLENKIQVLKQQQDTNTNNTLLLRKRNKNAEGKGNITQSNQQEDSQKKGRELYYYGNPLKSVMIYLNTLEPTVTFVIIRSVLVLVVFFVLHYLLQEYLLRPTFKPSSTFDPTQLTSKLCPPGVESCNYQLKDNWQDLLQQKPK
jgi:hypothetical protein